MCTISISLKNHVLCNQEKRNLLRIFELKKPEFIRWDEIDSKRAIGNEFGNSNGDGTKVILMEKN